MKDKNKKQPMRYSDSELAIIKSTFAENERFVKAIRKVFLQIKLNAEEKELIKGLNENVLNIIKKTFLPEIDGDAPLFQLIDLYMQLNIDLKDKSETECHKFIDAKEIEVNYLKQQYAVLSGEKVKIDIVLADLIDSKSDKYSKLCNIIARNFILSFVDSMLNQLIFLAGLKTETVEETINRLQKDSTQ